MPENGREKTPHISKMAQFLIGGKNGHFPKAIAKQSGRKCLYWDSKYQKYTETGYPLKSLELFYAENCSKTHLTLEK